MGRSLSRHLNKGDIFSPPSSKVLADIKLHLIQFISLKIKNIDLANSCKNWNFRRVRCAAFAGLFQIYEISHALLAAWFFFIWGLSTKKRHYFTIYCLTQVMEYEDH